MVAGAPHFAPAVAATVTNPACALPINPNHAGPPMRALLAHLAAWTRGEAEPPSSRVPLRSTGTLVEAARAMPVAIPGLPYAGLHVPAAQFDHGVTPSRELGRFAVFVPLADRDGMAVAGIRLPGWRRRALRTPRGIRVLNHSAPACCARCKARCCRWRRHGRSGRRRETRGSRSRSATRRWRTTSPRCAPPPSVSWRSACCSRRTRPRLSRGRRPILARGDRSRASAADAVPPRR